MDGEQIRGHRCLSQQDSQMRGTFQWRRGLVLAGIHLAICVLLVIWQEASRWDWLRSQENLPTLRLALPDPPLPPDAVKPIDEGETRFIQPLRHVAPYPMAGAIDRPRGAPRCRLFTVGRTLSAVMVARGPAWHRMVEP